MKDTIARRRSVLNSVVRQIAAQLSFEGEQQFNVTTRETAWKSFFAQNFYPGLSSEDVIRRDNWNETVLAIEAWAARRGVEFTNRDEERT